MKTHPELAFFLPQFQALMLGNSEHNINTPDDICRFAANCGITGIDIPYGMLPEPDRMLRDVEYRNEIEEKYRKLGTPIIRISSHTDGQRASTHTAYRSRFDEFADPVELNLSRNEIEDAAHLRIQKALRLEHLIGTKHHQTFPGGRGVLHHDQWSTLPENWHQYELMFLAHQWTPTFQVAHDHGDREIGFEIGHVMETIQTVQDLIDFRGYLPKHLRHLVKWGVDTSHFDKEGDEACWFVDAAIEANLDSPGHAKDAWFDWKLPGGRHRQNGLPFKDQAGKFEVFGVGNPDSALKFGEVLRRAHALGKFSYGVIEGEAMGEILDPFQGMEIAAENLRRVIDGKNPLSIEEIEIKPWFGPTFETFAKSNVPVSTLLELNKQELDALCVLAEQHGLPRPK